MQIVVPSFSFESPVDHDEIMQRLERAGRTCYKSEDKIGEDTASGFVRSIVKRGHESVLEHVSISVRIICDRGISHELVRHRIASFSQESTRYCNYASLNMQFICPDFSGQDPSCLETWIEHMRFAEAHYKDMLEAGCPAQLARSVLPNSLKTELVMTANLREWRHIFQLRCDRASHPQMRELMLPMLDEFQKVLPEVFGTIRGVL